MSRGNKYSKEKYQERIMFAINSLFRSDFDDPLLRTVTVTSVELNKDFSVAVVNWDTYNTEKLGDYKKAVSRTAGKMRSLLAGQLNVRHTPEIRFIYNSQYLDEMNITNLINQNSSGDDE
jgi:ribosome-binding factor A